MSPEKYKPTQDDLTKAEDMMSESQKRKSLAREEHVKVLKEEGIYDELLEASNSKTDPERLLELAKEGPNYHDEDDENGFIHDLWPIQEAVAKNPKASEETLTLLSKHKDFFVQEAVAKNLNTPPEILAKLSEKPQTRYFVASNQNTPTEILNNLVEKSHDEETKRMARKTLLGLNSLNEK